MPAVTLAEPDAHPRWFRTTRFQRNATGRPTVVDAVGLITRYDWGPDGTLCAITDADGATTGFEHDVLGRLVAQSSPDGARTEFLYDDLYDDCEGAPAVRPTEVRQFSPPKFKAARIRGASAPSNRSLPSYWHARSRNPFPQCGNELRTVSG